MNKIFYNFRYLIAITISLICISCSDKYDLSSPENTYDSYYKAVEKKDVKGMIRCFVLDADLYTEQNIKIMADKLFNEIIIQSHKVITKENISDIKADLVVEEVMKTKYNLTAKGTARIKFNKVNGEWKIYRSETLAFNPEIEPIEN